MHRFFTTDINGNFAAIHGDDVKHIARVLRLKPGDEIQVCDGNGKECISLIHSVGSDTVVAKVGIWQICKSEPITQVTLFQCLPKTGKMETIIQKCVELGIHSIVPVQSERCVAVLKPPYSNKIERWQRVSEEAAKQSRRGRIPTVEQPIGLQNIDVTGFNAVYVAYENEDVVTLKNALQHNDHNQTVAIVIGPEGGFSDCEIAALKEKGAISVSLGPRILRTETAGMAMLAQIMFEVES